MALASDILSLVDISSAAKLSAMDTTMYPARTIARQITTALTFIGISIAIADPLSKPSALSAYATNLHKMCQQNFGSHNIQKC